MAIPFPAGQVTQLAAADYNVHLAVQIVPQGGGVFEPTDYLVRGRISATMDEHANSMELEFDRGSGGTSLSPLMAGSSWNANGPLLYPGNFIQLSACVTAEGAAAGVFTAIFIGRIDGVDIAGPGTMKIRCSDVAAHYINRQIKVLRKYSGAVATVMSTLLTDNAFDPGGGFTVLGSPSFTVVEYLQPEVRVMEALKALARALGWDVRYFIRTGKLTFYDPGRDRTVPDLTITANEYIDIQKLEIDDLDVRNQWEGWYNGAARLRYYAEDAASMLQHGPKFARFAEDAQSHVNTLAEVTTMVQAALADTKDPLADHAVSLPFRPDIELNDLHEYVANSDHYSANIKWAVATFDHEFEQGWGITTIGTRGKPIAAHRDWRRGEVRRVHVYTVDPPAGTYLTGNYAKEGALWAKVASIAIA